MYSKAHARATAASIARAVEVRCSNADAWFKGAQAVPMGDVYSLYRCCLYPGWSQRYDGLWCVHRHPLSLSLLFCPSCLLLLCPFVSRFAQVRGVDCQLTVS